MAADVLYEPDGTRDDEKALRPLWQAVLEELRTRLSRSVYDSWIKNLTLLSLSENVALLSAPSSYTSNYIEARYLTQIAKSLSRIVGRDVSIKFVIEGNARGLRAVANQPALPLDVAVGAETVRLAPRTGLRSPRPTRDDENSAKQFAFLTDTHGKVENSRYNGESNPTQSVADAATERVAERNGQTLPAARASTSFSAPMVNTMNGGFSTANGPTNNLNSKYTFDRFIVGSSNRMANAAALAVAEQPGQAYNPLFIYGNVGLGKTHLLQGIGHQALERRPDLEVLYVTSEKFTNDLINAIRDNRQEAFRNRYRSIDILLIDDIAFIAGKEATQEEFFHTFNSLHESYKQIVITSDRPPRAMMTLEDRLRSRFEGGLIVDVQLPDYEMRMAILQAKAEQQGLHISPDVLDFIAHKVPSNIREVEGALMRVVGHGRLLGVPITTQVAAETLNDSHINSRSKKLTADRVVDVVANFFSLDPKELRGRGRSQDVVVPRQIAMYIMREQTEYSLVQIGEALGNRDHTTVMHANTKIEGEMETNSVIRQQVNTILQLLYADSGR